jgi:hypothetical protein
LFFSSGCISDDDNNHRNSSILSLSTDELTETIRPYSQDNLTPTNLSFNNNDISSENCNQTSGLFSHQSPRTRRNYQHFSHRPVCSPSPNPDRKKNEHHKRSQSCEGLSLSPLRTTTTNDSGTGNSVIHVPTETTPEPLHYEMVPVFGSSVGALMVNRYEFDPAKVAEYKNRKRPIHVPIFGNSASTVHQTTTKSDKQNSNEFKKSSNIFSFFLRPFKSSSTNQTHDLMIRHHPPLDENH